MYKRRRSHNFLSRFTELNYRLKYVEGAGVLTYAKHATKKAAAAAQSGAGVERSEADVLLAAPAAARPVRKRTPTPERASSPP